MLLRCSRISGLLEKDAFISGIGRAALKVGRGLKANEWKWGKRLAGGGLVAGVTGMGVAEAGKQSAEGLGEQSFQMRQEGLLPPGPPKAPKI